MSPTTPTTSATTASVSVRASTPEVLGRAAVGARVRLGGGSGAVPVPAGVLTVSTRAEGREVSRDDDRQRRLRYARRSPPRTQDGGAPPGLHGLESSRAAPLRHAAGELGVPEPPPANAHPTP